MFSIFKRASLKKALDACQEFLKSQEVDFELTEKQYQMTINISTFKLVESGYRERGVSQWGGLALYCLYSIEKALDAQKLGKTMSPEIIEFVNKTATIALTIPQIKLLDKDMPILAESSKIATEWLDKNSFDPNWDYF